MKIRIFLFAIIVMVSFAGQAQKIRTLYYTSQWELTTADSASYYRKCVMDTLRMRERFSGEVKDFTMEGQMMMAGNYQEGKKNGVFTFYYPSGQIEATGTYANDERVGDWVYYHPNNKLQHEIKFLEAEDFYVAASYNSEGHALIKDGTGEWVHSYEWYRFPYRFEIKGQMVDGKKEGDWVCTLSNGVPIYTETFKNGRLKNGIYFNPDGSVKNEFKVENKNKFLPPFKFKATEQFLSRMEIDRTHYPFLPFLKIPGSDTLSADEKVFLVAESPPEFVGGLEAMYKFIAKTLRYPASARRMGIEGNVFVEFVVEPDGSLVGIMVSKGISIDCDQEALRIVNAMPKWKPGMQAGKPVRVKFILPIKFKMG